MTSDIVLGAIVKNAPAGTVLNYTVTLSDSTIIGIYGDVAFIDGVAKLSIKSGSEFKATGLPIDITYEVTCEAPENCLITSINESGVTYGAESHVVFVCVFYEAEVEIENPVTSDDK